MALNSNFRTLTADNIEGIVDDKNYLKSSFENGTITGWTEVAVTLTSGLPTGTPTIGATAASSLALSATSVTPLSGSRSLLVDVPSALTAGHGFISDEFTLDRMDLGKVLTVSFDYERVTGTYNFSGTLGSQTWMVYIYDATLGAANWIQPAGFLGMNQSSGPGRVRATFQSSVTAGQKYRVAVIASQAAAGASSIEFDNFTCSRQTAPIGPVVTDWVDRGAITITGSTSNPTKGATAVDKMWTRRVGDNLEVRIEYVQSATGSAGSGDYLVSLPAGFSIDTNKVTADSAIEGGASDYTLNNSVGSANLGVTNNNLVGAVCVFDATRIRIFGITTDGVGVNRGAWGSTFYSLNTANVFMTASFSVPISGWSSNVQLSNDTDTRVVAARMFRSTTQAITGTAFNKVLLNSSSFDTHSAFDSANSLYRIPVSGFYRVTGCIYGSAITSSFVQTRLAKNGTGFADAFQIAGSTSDALAIATDIVQCNAGDTIELFVASGDSSYTVQNSSNTTYLSIERLSGPSVVAASETVAARYTNASGQSIPNNSTTAITGWTRDYDTHSILNSGTGVVTIPISGKYTFSHMTTYNSGTVAVNNQFSVEIQQAGSVTRSIQMGAIYAQNNVSFFVSVTGSTTIHCNAGDTVTIVAFQNSGAARTLAGGANFNHVSITRVGN